MKFIKGLIEKYRERRHRQEVMNASAAAFAEDMRRVRAKIRARREKKAAEPQVPVANGH